MPAYIVSVCEFTNITPELKIYAQKSADLAHRHGGKYIVRGKPADVMEGDKLAGKSMVILEFPTLEQLTAYVKGDEYQKNVKPLRKGTGIYDIGIYDGAPPDKQ
jgi:uncharacterized protein (DUF1330 family)